MAKETLYTLDRNGQRYGPYSREQLQTYLAQGLVQGSDLVWAEGMPTWAAVNQVVSSVAVSEPWSAPAPPAPAPQPRTPNLAQNQNPMVDPGATALASGPPPFLGFQGRIGRARYFWTSFGLNAAFWVIAVGLGALVNVAAGGSPSEGATMALGFLVILLWVGTTAIVVLQGIKRFHDLDRPGTHYWFLLVPFYNIYIGILLLFMRGTMGANQYGPDPLGVPASFSPR